MADNTTKWPLHGLVAILDTKVIEISMNTQADTCCGSLLSFYVNFYGKVILNNDMIVYSQQSDPVVYEKSYVGSTRTHNL